MAGGASSAGSRIHELAARFRLFGEVECVPSSPLYSLFAVGVSGDTRLLEIAAHAAGRGQPVPNLLFGAVQYLLLSGVEHRLARLYPSVGGAAHAGPDAWPDFRDFCLEHQGQIRDLIGTRLVQTNEVRRCALTLPALAHAAESADGAPLAIVEIGASAGLTLLWDRYGYEYAGARVGDLASAVQLRCEPRGRRPMPIPARVPEIAWRAGLDLHPIDVRDPHETRWLRALVWPEMTERARLLSEALAIAARNPPDLRAGDALALLPGVLDQVPQSAMLCVVHTFTLNQFTPAMRGQLTQLLGETSRRRPLWRIGVEWREPAPELRVELYRQGQVAELLLAQCDAHGSWIDWQGAASV